MARTAHTGWRRVFAGVLIYAFVLQSFIFALDITRPAFAAADGANGATWAGFELCSHGGAGATVPGAPAQGPIGRIHCLFCIAGAVYVNSAPPCAAQYSNIVVTNVAWPLAAPRLVALRVKQSAWPRGPPGAA